MKESKTVTNILLICLVLIMLSFTTFGVVFARYLKKDENKTTATIAHFDIEMEWESIDIFLNEYIEENNASKLVTVAKSDNKIVAPNTKGSIILNVRGCADVPFDLVINLEELYSDNWKTSEGGEVYHPIVLSVTTNLRGSEIPLIIQSGQIINLGVFDALVELNGQVKIIWEWPYHTSDSNDDADTYMSSLGNDATYGLKATATATQVQ